MKFAAICQECTNIAETTKSVSVVEFNVTESSTYSLKCRKGHNVNVALQAMKFELLYEIGCDAFIDGHHHPSVSVFSVSLERFFEFIVLVYILKSKSEKTDYVQTWKQMQNQSERQLGAFLLSYLSLTGNAYSLNQDMVAFRNKVIHRGHIPTVEEAEKYGEYVLKEIYTVCMKLKELDLWGCVMRLDTMSI